MLGMITGFKFSYLHPLLEPILHSHKQGTRSTTASHLLPAQGVGQCIDHKYSGKKGRMTGAALK